MTSPADFQRARSPEQRDQRREEILAAAAHCLREMPFTEIRLRELGQRAGLATSAVVRYFGTREGVFLELLEREWAHWIKELPAELPSGDAPGNADNADSVGRALARSLASRPLLCELFSVLAGVLEHNIPLERARAFKRGGMRRSEEFAALVRDRLPGLDAPASLLLASTVITSVAGLWPFTSPSDTVCAAIASDPELTCAAVDFEERMREMLTAFIRGLQHP
ncbi:TetR/AcrR family transcriptional regulator [Streptomyces zingiberis]|uniref:TetR/AcrR family transcriptional regulator n=1 Tax=Streptomyces zingiberis TaxID=2053010 RepID=A0ABX1C2J4_9ACTN|nr:TetR/AcrR family transcriptional regulator [Streptomyces zingiberis]NJQ01854.1 TetR/AcrR family transcriptional regulator [Streptomyces zingiberis]